MLHGCEIMNYSLFLSCVFCSCDIRPLWFWDCAPLFVPPPHPLPVYPSLPFVPLPCSSRHLSVVYQDGFYSAADLYVSTLTSNPTHICSLPHSPPCSFFLFFFSASDSACCVQSCAVQSHPHKGI